MPRPNRGAHLDTNERGIYEIRLTERGRSRRYSTGAADLGVAQKALAAFLLGEREAAVSASKPRVRETVQAYYDAHLAKQVSERNNRRSMKLVQAVLGGVAIEDLGPAHVEQYVKARGVSSGSCRTELAVLVAAINWHILTKRFDPKLRPYFPLPEKAKPRERWLTVEEAETIRRLAAGRSARLRLFVEIGLETGQRPKAIYGLRRRLVDLARRVIDTRPLYTTKKKRGAVVPISDRLLPVIVQACEGLAPDDLVLGRGGLLNKQLADLAVAAKIAHFTPHTLRHTYGSHAIQNGVPIEHVAAVMGDTIATVEETYLKHDPDRLRGAVNFDRRKTA
jgi:integrase